MDTSYHNKKNRERAQYEVKSDGKSTYVKRLMHHPLIFSPARYYFNFVFPKTQMADVVISHLSEREAERILIAPCGTGDDVKYLQKCAGEVYGIDLSPIAVQKCPNTMKAKVGDILHLEYPSAYFDLVASPLFFHHMVHFGFHAFLREIHRVLKPGGGFVALEPSLWYPLNLITRPLKHILGNPYDELEDEGPFRPTMMLQSLKRVGFVNIQIQAASFSHCSFYIPVAKIVNKLTRPFLRVAPFKYFGWLVVYWAERKHEDATDS